MRRILSAFLVTGCISGGQYVQRDDRVLREIQRQDRWAQQAIDAKPEPDQLESIRGGDPRSVAAARKELQKLIQAANRGTWIREAAADVLRDDPGDAQLAQEFDRAGGVRADALQAADDLAAALAQATGGVTVSDLRPGLDAVNKARASEDKLAKLPVVQGRQRLAPAHVPEAFGDVVARLVAEHPESRKDLDRLPPDQAAKIRARVADLDREREDQRRAQPKAPAPSEHEAEAPPDTLRIANDAQALISRKVPRSIRLREDGLFALSYDDADYLVDTEGRLVRKENPGAGSADDAAPRPPPAGSGDPKPAGPGPQRGKTLPVQPSPPSTDR